MSPSHIGEKHYSAKDMALIAKDHARDLGLPWWSVWWWRGMARWHFRKGLTIKAIARRP